MVSAALAQFLLTVALVVCVFIYNNRQRLFGGSSSSQAAAGAGGAKVLNKLHPGLVKRLGDNYRTLEEVAEALRKNGLESCNLIIGIDYTKSNENSGRRTFGGLCLHAIGHSTPENPYMKVISVMGRTLEPFDEDKLIPTFGFGDINTKAHSVFPFYKDRLCYTFQEVLERYIEITPLLSYSGPTSFAPLIREAIEIVKKARDYHILVIIADGQVDRVNETAQAIVEASKYPLSIVMIGVGDGPWDQMKEFDDALPERIFDNFQFVNFNEVTLQSRDQGADAAFATAALMEIPNQYQLIKQLGYLN